jgi:hypothetical protein
VRQSPLLRGRFSFQDEVPGSSPGRPATILPAQRADAPNPVALPARLGRGGGRMPYAPVEPRTCRSGRPQGPGPPPEPTRGRRRCPAQVMVGRMPPTLTLATCAQPCHRLGAQRPYLLPDRRAILRNRRVLAGHAIEPGPLPERLHDDDQVQPDVAAGPARPAPAQPCGCPTHRRALRSHRCGHNGRGRGRGMRGHRRTPRTMDTRTPDVRTPDTSHRTPDAWTLTEDAERATTPRQASRHLGHHGEPTARWTPNRVPMGGSACGARPP